MKNKTRKGLSLVWKQCLEQQSTTKLVIVWWWWWCWLCWWCCRWWRCVSSWRMRVWSSPGRATSGFGALPLRAFRNSSWVKCTMFVCLFVYLLVFCLSVSSFSPCAFLCSGAGWEQSGWAPSQLLTAASLLSSRSGSAATNQYYHKKITARKNRPFQEELQFTKFVCQKLQEQVAPYWQATPPSPSIHPKIGIYWSLNFFFGSIPPIIN